MSCGGGHLHITTLKQDILYTGFEHIHSDLILRCWLIRQFGQMDGRAHTCTKKGTFFQKRSFGSDGSKLDGHFLSLDAFFPTFGCHPDGAQPQKGKFEGDEKGLCMFSLCGQIMQGNGVAKLEQ
jgi:hypothetical protein